MTSAKFLVVALGLFMVSALAVSVTGCKEETTGGGGTGGAAGMFVTGGLGGMMATGGVGGMLASGGAGGVSGMTATGGVGGMMATGGVGGMMMMTGGTGGMTGGVGGMMATGGMGGTGMDAGVFTLASSAFEDGGLLPAVHRCMSLGGMTGPSPALSWTGAPAGTMSFAITLTDITAGGSMGYMHWTIYDIPAMATSLPEGVMKAVMPSMPAGAKQSAQNQSLFVPGPGYFGPCGSGGTNTYELKIFALDVATLPDVMTSTAPAMIRAKIEEHDVATATLTLLSMP